MKSLIKIVAMASVIFLFTGCNPVDKILESEKFKNSVDEKIKSEIDMQLNKFSNNQELKELIASQTKEIDNLKLKVDTLESNIKNLENKTKEQSEKVKNMFN